MWTQERLYSKSDWCLENLNESNHIFNNQGYLLEIYNPPLNIANTGKGMEFTFTSWVDSKMEKNNKGEPLDIIVHKKEDIIVWEPFVEYLMRRNFLDTSFQGKIKMGYITGEKSIFGPFHRYQFWIESSNF